MTRSGPFSPRTAPRDLLAGTVVFLVALPLCLGIALASGAPLVSGLVAGIIGGLVVGPLSGSHTSVSGPAAGLAAVVAAQILALGSFEAFLVAVALAGVIQIAIGLAQAGSISSFFPTSVIKGLLSAIGLILILKQVPHLFGHDTDPEGEMAFRQPDDQTTLSELGAMWEDIHLGAAVIGLTCLALLTAWARMRVLRQSPVPAPLVVVGLGVAMAAAFESMGERWSVGISHLVQVPVSDSVAGFFGSLPRPDLSIFANPSLYVAAVTIALVASLETLLNLEAVDKLDPDRRHSPPNRELVAQGVGNLTSGLLGGLPLTSVIIRSSVNINSGGKTKLSAFVHGVLLFGLVLAAPGLLNRIPLSCLAAILIVTGIKLASPQLLRQMWRQGHAQFVPYVTTVLAIVFTDLLVGIMIGLGVAVFFILRANLKVSVRRATESGPQGERVRIELGEQVSFLNRASISEALDDLDDGSEVVFDGSKTAYLDADVLGLLREFRDTTGPARGIAVSMVGFDGDTNL
jgi:MFS superfamily sulfate permease-like transporter